MITIPAELLSQMSLSDFARLTEAHLQLLEQRWEVERLERSDRPTEPAPAGEECPTLRVGT